MSTKGAIGTQGLKTSGNELAFPPGTLTQAQNAVIPSKMTLQPRRGAQLLAGVYVDGDPTNSNGNTAAELWQWNTGVFCSYQNGAGGVGGDYALSFIDALFSSPTFYAIGPFFPPNPTAMRMKFAALSKSAYWTTSVGLGTVDKAGGTVRKGGIQRPSDFLIIDPDAGLFTRLASAPNATGTWLKSDAAVAYRAVMGFKDANDVVRLSAPNGRLVVANPLDLVIAINGVVLTSNVVTVTLAAGQTHGYRPGDQVAASSADSAIGVGPYTITAITATTFTYAHTAANHTNTANPVTFQSGFKTVQLVLGLPAQALAGWFVQLFRTDESITAAVDPGDECFQCYERVITAADVSNGYVTIQDTTPSVFLGPPLRTNANSGLGPELGSNERPPLVDDITVWDGRLWGGNVTQRHRLEMRLLGVGPTAGIQVGDAIAINAHAIPFVLPGAGGGIPVYSSGLASQNVQQTLQVMTAYIGAKAIANIPGVTAKSLADGDSPTGNMLVDEIEVATDFSEPGGGSINAIYAGCTRPSAFQEPLGQLTVVTAGSRTSNVVSVQATAHGLKLGDTFMLAGVTPFSANFHPGLKVVSVFVDANNFKYAEAGSNATMGGGSYYVYPATFKSTADKYPLAYSDAGEPEAWPLPNFPGGLPDGAVPLRIKPSPDNGSLLVMLKDGDTYQVSGQYPYSTRRVDGTASLVAADSLVEHNGSLTGLTTQGVATISAVGIGVVSLDIRDTFQQLARNIGDGFIDQAYETWALSYESDHQYQLWTPNPATPSSDSGSASQALVFDSMEQQWSGPTLSSRTCGLVLRGADIAFYGDVISNQLLVENKTFGTGLFNSFFDRKGTITAVGNQSGVTTVAVSDTSQIVAGDALKLTSVFYRVLAVPDGSHLVLDKPITVTNGTPLTYFNGYPVQATFAMESAGIPGIDKVFREVQLHFGERSFTTLTVTFTNEKSLVPYPVTVTDATNAIGTPKKGSTIMRVDVPRDVQQSAQLKIQITLTEALSYFELLGYSATSTPSSERTGR